MAMTGTVCTSVPAPVMRSAGRSRPAGPGLGEARVAGGHGVPARRWWSPPTRPGRPLRPRRRPWPSGGRRLRRWCRGAAAAGAVHHQVVPLDGGVHPEGADQLRRPGQAVGLLHPELADVPEPGGARGPPPRPRPGWAPRPGRGSPPPPPPCRAAGRSSWSPIRSAGRLPRSRWWRPSAAARRGTRAARCPGGWRPPSTRLPGTMTPPTNQKAAWEGSPGTVKAPGRQGAPADPDHPTGPDPLELDVGARRGQHLLGVGPGGDRLVDHRLALGGEAGQQDGRLDLGAGHRRRVVDARAGRRRSPTRGGSRGRPCPSTRPPWPAAGSATRSMGRCASESSPVRVVVPGRAAATPASSRSPVPELPRSRVAAGARAGDRPPAMVTRPSAVRRRRRGRPPRPGSGPRRRPSESPSMVEVPSASAASRTARWEMDLSPGTATVPARGRPPRTTWRAARVGAWRSLIAWSREGSPRPGSPGRPGWPAGSGPRGGRPAAPARPGRRRPSGRSPGRRC